MQSDIMVSIWCITYNHEKYIKEALESFIKQKTNFKFEVIVHDDASTDNTPQIVRTYAKQYPDIIKPVFQTENKFSKGFDVNLNYCFPHSEGKYVALCEGDDFWVDDLKLQKQVDYMESHSDCSLCFHNAKIINYDGSILNDSFLPKSPLFAKYYKDYDSEYSTDEIILLDFFPTNSMLFRRKDVSPCVELANKRQRVCGDLIYRIYFASCGYAYYFNEKMSIYRKGVESSVSTAAFKNSYTILHNLNGHFEILDDFNEYTQKKFDNSIQTVKKLKLYEYLWSIKSLKIFDEQLFFELYRKEPFQKRMSFRLKGISPTIQRMIRRALRGE